jgi:hypothetical protein
MRPAVKRGAAQPEESSGGAVNIFNARVAGNLCVPGDEPGKSR